MHSQQAGKLTISVADAKALIEASHDSILRLCDEVERGINESPALDPCVAGDLANWTAEMATLTRIAVELLREIAANAR